MDQRGVGARLGDVNRFESNYIVTSDTATRIAREAYRSGLRRFIAVGGDGTGFEIVNGLFPEALGARDKPSLGFLPPQGS